MSENKGKEANGLLHYIQNVDSTTVTVSSNTADTTDYVLSDYSDITGAELNRIMTLLDNEFYEVLYSNERKVKASPKEAVKKVNKLLNKSIKWD